MVKDNNFIKESSSIIEEIEAQLQNVLAKKKEQVEHELEEKIRAEQEDAQKRIDQIESELKGNKEALENYKNVLTQFESDKEGVKSEIKGHLDKAIQLQTDIEQMTGQTLQELKTVSELTKKLEEINHEASTKVNALKTELEEKYGIVAQVPESNGHDEVDFDLENELAKLQKIKELLGSTDVVIKSVERDMEEEGTKEEPVEAAPEEEEKAEEAAEVEAEAEAEAGEEAEVKEEPTEGNESAAEAEATEVAEEEAAEKTEEEVKGEEEGEEEFKEEAEAKAETETKEADDADATAETKADESFKTAFEALDKYRKSETVEGNGYMVFYENEGKIVLDGESFVAYLNNNLEEVKRLYNKLQETESPKDQFFTKQEIIKKQDILRKYMLSFIGKGELEVSNLPEFTEDILNMDMLKNILEKVSMENWSNHEDFTSFDKLTNDLKESFYEKITPPDKYLESIRDELEGA
jgi:translation initiation factor 2 beta subunit (eIF-2beta)/eIF-5